MNAMSDKTVAELMALARVPLTNQAAIVNARNDADPSRYHKLLAEQDAAFAALEQAIRRAVDWEQVAWIDSNGHPHHMSELQGVRDEQLYGRWTPLYARRQDQ